MSKILYVSSPVQAALMSLVFIPELVDGFWKNHRPAGHGDVWKDVQVLVSEDGTLGPVGFDAPRNYNFLNLDFALPNEAKLVVAAQTAKPNSNFKSVKKELIELGRIVGSRLPTRDASPVKLFRGNHKEGTVTVSSARARRASSALIEAGGTTFTQVITPVTSARKTTVKKTVTRTLSTAMQIAGATAKPKTVTKNHTTQAKDVAVFTTTAQGATVRRVPVPT